MSSVRQQFHQIQLSSGSISWAHFTNSVYNVPITWEKSNKKKVEKSPWTNGHWLYSTSAHEIERRSIVWLYCYMATQKPRQGSALLLGSAVCGKKGANDFSSYPEVWEIPNVLLRSNCNTRRSLGCTRLVYYTPTQLDNSTHYCMSRRRMHRKACARKVEMVDTYHHLFSRKCDMLIECNWFVINLKKFYWKCGITK